MRIVDASVEIDTLDWSKGNGLVPAIVQDASTRQVLMLGYMNAEALRATLESGLVTFYSRSRQALWQKGESSGNTLRTVSIHLDCDRDTLLVFAEPAGPVCHLGTTSCFDDGIAPGIGWLAQLERIIATRKGADPASSYTSSLFGAGPVRIAQTVGEEGVETALAGALGDRDKLTEEAADLLYHLIVLLQTQDISLEQISDHLRSRHEE